MTREPILRNKPSMLVESALLALLGVGLLATLAASIAPRDRDTNVAVVFPPWTPGATAVERATARGGTLVRTGRLPFIVIVHPGPNGFERSAGRLGAWLLLDASRVRGCSPAGEARR